LAPEREAFMVNLDNLAHSRLLIRHRDEPGSLHFEVQRVDSRGAKAAAPVALSDPLRVHLGESDLMLGHELTWYLESYLDLPTGPHVQRAERVLAALRQWGRASFETLFGRGQARDFYHDAARAGRDGLHIVVASDDPRVLSWPWESLYDPQLGDLAHHCRIDRQLDAVPDPLPLPTELPQDHVRILLVTARPYHNDVAFRSITRPLVELIQQEQLPAEVKLLRPPTFAQLQHELSEHPGQYHIVHFDGHGGFGPVSSRETDRFRGPQGQLLFEDAEGSEDPVTADQLSQLLRRHCIPIAVLNACQSAKLTEQADDAFASVATALLRAGVRSVVAMGYSLYVDGARQFLPAFYRQLFRTGNVAQATLYGRRAMLEQPERMGLELQDWLVPVLYQQEALELQFAVGVQKLPSKSLDAIPLDARVETSNAPHGVIGRDGVLLALERASRRAPAAMLLHGLGGVGKTTLARGYIEWLAHTQGLPDKVIWQSLIDVRSFDFLSNRLVEALFGTDALAASDAQKWSKLTETLRKEAVLIVWDNFESAIGLADAGIRERREVMAAQDRQQLRQFLELLRGGRSKVLITSRSDETWLGTTACFRVSIGGLHGEERRELARAILADQGLRLDPRDAATVALVESLHGHPLMMRAILPRLAHTPATELTAELDRYIPQAGNDDPVEQRLYATLRYVEDGIPDVLLPLLEPIGLHDGYVDVDYLVEMAACIGQPFSPTQVKMAFERLETAGLLRRVDTTNYEMHPALGRYLRIRLLQKAKAETGQRAWESAFCVVIANLAQVYARKQFPEQRPVFMLFSGNFERALELSHAHGKLEEVGKLLHAQGAYAINCRNLPLAEQKFEAYRAICEQRHREDLVAESYYSLGVVAHEQREFKAAEIWYVKALEILERQGNEVHASQTYQELGRLADSRRDFVAAEGWYCKSLEATRRRGDMQGTARVLVNLGTTALGRHDIDVAEGWYRMSLAITERQADDQLDAVAFHQLGIIAEMRKDFDTAEDWYRKALAISERQGNHHLAAKTCQQLGTISRFRRDFGGAESWLGKALVIHERQGNEHGAAAIYYQLGGVSQAQRDFDGAEGWFRKSLAIYELGGDSHGAALTYNQLGTVAQARRDFGTAECWYRKSLESQEGQGDENGADSTYHKLVIVAQALGNFDAAESWYRRTLASKERQGGERCAEATYHHLATEALQWRDFDAAEVWHSRALAIHKARGDDQGEASTYHNLGVVAHERPDLAAAEGWYRKALVIFERLGNENCAATYSQLGTLASLRGDPDAAEDWHSKALAIYEKYRNEHGAGVSCNHLGSAAQNRSDFESAERWFKRALAVFQRRNDESRAGAALLGLAIAVESQRGLTAAEGWYRKAQASFDRQGNAQIASGIRSRLQGLASSRETPPAQE
jgi:tetratricopeptide (TPR) repeat protein